MKELLQHLQSAKTYQEWRKGYVYNKIYSFDKPTVTYALWAMDN